MKITHGALAPSLFTDPSDHIPDSEWDRMLKEMTAEEMVEFMGPDQDQALINLLRDAVTKMEERIAEGEAMGRAVEPLFRLVRKAAADEELMKDPKAQRSFRMVEESLADGDKKLAEYKEFYQKIKAILEVYGRIAA